MKNLLKLLLVMLISSMMTAQTTLYNEESFENRETIYDIDDDLAGNGTDYYGIWIDGGSNAYQKSSEKYWGDYSFVITKPADATKPNYGSIYTKPIDMSNQTGAELEFNYVILNSNGDTPTTGGFEVQVSSDGGETWNTMRSFYLATENIYKSTESIWEADCKASCYDLILPQAIQFCRTSCGLTRDTGGIPGAELRNYWSQANTIDLPAGTAMTSTMVFRIKSFLNDSVTKVYIDDVEIKYTGGTSNPPVLSETSVMPTNSTATSNRTQYNYENFDAGAVSGAWGIWQDGGRNVYDTDFLANEGLAACIRNRFVSDTTSNGVDPDTGEDLGFQKPTYSSILTKNTNFSEVSSLELSFSFVAYGMEISEQDYFDLSISTNSGVDFTTVATWVAGQDFINSHRYAVNIAIPGNLTSNGALTSTTMIKLQTHGDEDTDQVYIDDLYVYTVGTASSLAGTQVALDWSGAEQTVINATYGSTPTYDVINSKFIKSEYYDDASFEGNNPSTDSDDVIGKPGIYGAVEHTDCDHGAFGEHITQEYDTGLGKNVFAFHVHDQYDTDRCRTDGLYDDRQRVEIKTYSQSYDHQKGLQDETHFLAWRFKLPTGFEASNKFTHLHQLKPKGGDHAGMPLITLTAYGPSTDDNGTITTPAALHLRYSPLSDSQVTVLTAPLSDFEGQWVQVVEKITFGAENQGVYEIRMTPVDDVETTTPIMDFKSYSLPMWKPGGSFIRPKWGVYRSIVQIDQIKDEIVRFSDVVVLKSSDSNAKNGDLISFANYIQDIEITQQNTAPIGSTIQLRKGGGNNRFVTAEQSSDDNQLIARATALGAWEKFVVEEHPSGGIALLAKSNNKYVQVQGNNQNAPVRAAGNAMGTWEQFEWVPQGDGKVALKSMYTGKWVQANWYATNAVLYPKGAAVGTWETFLFEVVDSDLLKDDSAFLDPYDDYGNKWFETEQDKSDFLNAILTATGTTADTAPASLKEDLFVASVRSDDDREYDNKDYHTIVLVKSDVEQEFFDDLENNYADRHVFNIQLFIGANITTAKFNLNQDVPTGYWGEDLVNIPYEILLTSSEINADRSVWLELEVDFYSIMNSLTIWGK